MSPGGVRTRGIEYGFFATYYRVENLKLEGAELVASMRERFPDATLAQIREQLRLVRGAVQYGIAATETLAGGPEPDLGIPLSSAVPSGRILFQGEIQYWNPRLQSAETRRFYLTAAEGQSWTQVRQGIIEATSSGQHGSPPIDREIEPAITIYYLVGSAR